MPWLTTSRVSGRWLRLEVNIDLFSVPASVQGNQVYLLPDQEARVESLLEEHFLLVMDASQCWVISDTKNRANAEVAWIYDRIDTQDSSPLSICANRCLPPRLSMAVTTHSLAADSSVHARTRVCLL